MSETSSETLKIEIDGHKLEVDPGTTIIQAADNAGIHIPRFCYHKHLSVVANCRMCLVELEGGRKPMPACATDTSDGMKVYTKSQGTMAAQKAVMEFLLANHPLDCPICDQGGECELQDNALEYGRDFSEYTESKRSVPHKDIGPLIDTALTRCIHCTRCVRFGEQIAGVKELGMTHRGELAEIATFLDANVDSEVSGNVIDLCPVGALINKPFRYRARSWEMAQRPQIAPHDCLGSHIYAHVLRGQIMRAVPKECETINQTWVSDRDRYGHFGLASEERLSQPMVKRDGEWESVSWENALEILVTRVKRVVDSEGADSIGALASASATTEELYLLQKLMRSLGSNNIDHRLHTADFSNPQISQVPVVDCHLSDLAASDYIAWIGGNVRKDQPMLHLRMRQAQLSGSKIGVINPAHFDFRFAIEHEAIVDQHQMLHTVAALAKAVVGKKSSLVSDDFYQLVDGVKIPAVIKSMAAKLKQAQNPIVFTGQLVQSYPQAALITQLVAVIKAHLGAKGGPITLGANAAGAWLAGAVPHRQANGAATVGAHAGSMLTDKALSVCFLLNTEPEFDSIYRQQAANHLRQSFVVSLSPFLGAGMDSYADMVLPIASYAETSGTYVNAMGSWQSFQGVAEQFEASRPAWKVLRVLANLLELEGFDFTDSSQVLAECRQQVEAAPQVSDDWVWPDSMPAQQKVDNYLPVNYKPIYAVDNIVRRSEPLQATKDACVSITVSSKVAQKLSVSPGELLEVTQGQIKVKLPVAVDSGMGDNSVLIPFGVPETLALSDCYGEVQLAKA